MKRAFPDILILIACVAAVLLAFLLLIETPPAGQEDDVAPTPAPTPCVNVVALSVTPQPGPTPIPTPKAEQDKLHYIAGIPLDMELQYTIWESCEENNVGMALALGVIEVESGFDQNADNGVCYGLMQLNRNYFPGGLPACENIRHGVEYIGRLLTKYGDEAAALTAYNAGHDTGNRLYANAVLATAEKWRECDMAVYYNAFGRCLQLYERPLEPPDCWADEELYDDEFEEYDRGEDELEHLRVRPGTGIAY